MAVGIVCEFNPFHNGHEYLLSQAGKLSGEKTVCVMSGNFVQRGEYACADKKLRAGWAVSHGADIVFENPFPFSCSTAERFASSAAAILLRSGLCSAIAFGTENENSGEKDFYEAAEILLDSKSADRISDIVKSSGNIGYARARYEYILEKYGEKTAALLSSPNSILGVEYAKAALSMGKRPILIPIPRKGAFHDGVPDNEGKYASAGFLRSLGNADILNRYCPADVAEYFSSNKMTSIDKEKFYSAVSARLLMSDINNLAETADMPYGYAAKIVKAVYNCGNYDDFYLSLKAKHMTDARLRRIILFALMGTLKADLEKIPESALLLGCSQDGAALLKKLKKEAKSEIEILSKLSDIGKLAGSDAQIYSKEIAAEKLFSRLCAEN